MISVKYWYALTNYFGLGDSFQGGPRVDTNGSSYVEANGTYDLGDGWGLAGHVGLQSVRNSRQFADVTGKALSHTVGRLQGRARRRTRRLGGRRRHRRDVKKDYFGTATSFEAGGKLRPLVSVSKTF